MNPAVSSAASAAPARVQPLTALLLSAAVLPGLGQLLTGRLAKGALMVGAVTVWLPIALIKLGRDISLILPDLLDKAAESGPLYLADFQTALSPMAGGLVWLFAPLLTIWFWALFDSLIYLKQSRASAGHNSQI